MDGQHRRNGPGGVEKSKAARSRVLAFQPLSVKLEQAGPVRLVVQGTECTMHLRPTSTDPAVQRAKGGTYVAIEYSSEDDDLFRIAQKGMELIEDVLSALSLVEGAVFGDTEPVQVLREAADQGNFQFAVFPDLAMRYWDRPISIDSIVKAGKLLSHWDGLDSGARLRRAARQYRRALDVKCDLLSFQNAYMGLEALEKALALAAGVSPGVEEVQGKCDKCGTPYVKRRTMLAGVRAYISGSMHSEAASKKREQEWKDINELRQLVFHCLGDLKPLMNRASDLLPAIMHYLHDAICCLSHAHSLESASYAIARQPRKPVILGTYQTDNLKALEEWGPDIEFGEANWVDYAEYSFVPTYTVRNSGLTELACSCYWLNAPLGHATEDDLMPATVELEA